MKSSDYIGLAVFVGFGLWWVLFPRRLTTVGTHNAIGTLTPNQSFYSFVDFIPDFPHCVASLPLGIG